MDSKFSPPKNQEEFLKRAEPIQLKAALSLRNALLQRRASAVRALDLELDFVEKVIDLKNGKEVKWDSRD